MSNPIGTPKAGTHFGAEVIRGGQHLAAEEAAEEAYNHSALKPWPGVPVSERNRDFLMGRSHRLASKNDDPSDVRLAYEIVNAAEKWHIAAPWGQEVTPPGTPEDQKQFAQEGLHGDFIVQDESDPDQTWVIRRKAFHDAFTFISDSIHAGESFPQQ